MRIEMMVKIGIVNKPELAEALEAGTKFSAVCTEFPVILADGHVVSVSSHNHSCRELCNAVGANYYKRVENIEKRKKELWSDYPPGYFKPYVTQEEKARIRKEVLQKREVNREEEFFAVYLRSIDHNRWPILLSDIDRNGQTLNEKDEIVRNKVGITPAFRRGKRVC